MTGITRPVSSLKTEPCLAQRTVAKMISCAPQAKQIPTSECRKRGARQIMSNMCEILERRRRLTHERVPVGPSERPPMWESNGGDNSSSSQAAGVHELECGTTPP